MLTRMEGKWQHTGHQTAGYPSTQDLFFRFQARSAANQRQCQHNHQSRVVGGFLQAIGVNYQ